MLLHICVRVVCSAHLTCPPGAPPCLSFHPAFPSPVASIKEAGTRTRLDCDLLTGQPKSQRGKARMTSTANRLAHELKREQGFGTKQHAVSFSEQDYEALRRQCLKSRCLFEDSCFPAESKSLGFRELGPYSPKTRGVVWKRPTVRSLQITVVLYRGW